MHVVVFPGWYPNKLDSLSGDFIQRHMQAVSRYCKTTVIIPVKDASTKRTHTIENIVGNLTEQYIYYPSLTSIQWLDALYSFYQYTRFAIRHFKKANSAGKVSLVHLYVLQKNYGIGFISKWLFGIPYVISEQSTFYVDGQFEKASGLHKWLMRFAFNNSAGFHAVSAYLQKSIVEKRGIKTPSVVIGNVVDTSLFNYLPKPASDVCTFVHVSNMVPQKNVEGMLHAFAAIKKSSNRFKLNLVGPTPAHIPALVHDLGLNEHVVLWHAQPYSQVAAILKQSDVFVFFTRYETFGCVIIEANATGLPVIVSDLEVIHELVTEKENGLFVENGNELQLQQKLVYTMQHLSKFDRAAIAKKTSADFNYDAIGRRLFEWYKETTNSNMN